MGYARAIILIFLACLTVTAQPLTPSELAWPRRFRLADLTAWLMADQDTFSDLGVTPATNGQRVQWWTDQSRNGRNATNVNYPTLGYGPVYLTNQLNGLPILRFTLTNLLYVSLTGSTNDYSPDAAYIALIKYTLPGNSVTFYTSQLELGKKFGDDSAYVLNTNGYSSGGILVTNQWHIVAWILNGSNSLIRIDGTNAFAGNVSPSLTYFFGVGSGSAGVGSADIAEIMRHDSQIPLTAIQGTELYLSNKWGL